MMEMIGVGLYVFFEAMSMIVCLHYLYGEKIYLDKFFVIYLSLDLSLMLMINRLNLPHQWSLIMLLLLILYSSLRFGFQIKKLIINNVLQIIILSGLQALIMMVYATIVNNHKLETIDVLIINVIIFLFVVVVLRKCKLEKLSDILQNNEKIVIAVLILIIILAALSILNYKWTPKIEILYYIVFGISIVLIVITAIDIGRNKIKVKEAEAELRLHKLYEASFQELIDEIRGRQHEFDNHINAIYSQHRLYKTYDELVAAQQKYCDVIVEENHFNKVLSKGNPVILGFLWSEFSKMRKVGISIEYEINIGNLECSMPIHKMVELLGNLINNAMEAVMKTENRKVYVMMREDINCIQIEVFNVSQMIDEKKLKEFFKRGYSDKGEKRGYGLYNVRKICEEYHAAIVCKNEIRKGENGILFGIMINKPL